MKKILLLLFISSSAWAGINVTPGVGKTVHTDTVGGDEYQAVKIIDGTTGGTSSATVTSVGLRVDVGTASVVNSTVGVVEVGGWTLTNSTMGVVTAGLFQISQSTIAVVSGGLFQIANSTIGVNGVVADSSSFTLGTTPGLPIMGEFHNVVLPLASTTTAVLRMTPYRSLYVTPMDTAGVVLGTSTTNPIQTQTVILSTPPVTVTGSTIAISNIQGIVQDAITSTPTVTVILSTITVGNIQQWGGTAVLTGGQNGSVGVGGLATVGSGVGGRPVSLGVLVSSSAFETQQTDAKEQWGASDQAGRTLVQPMVPTTMVLFTTTTITTQTTEFVLISSNTTGYNHLIGCMGQNSSATNTYVTFRGNGGPGGLQANSFTLGFPANNVPVGFFPPGGIPQKVTNANWTVQGNASVTSLFLTCEYYQMGG